MWEGVKKEKEERERERERYGLLACFPFTTCGLWPVRKK